MPRIKLHDLFLLCLFAIVPALGAFGQTPAACRIQALAAVRPLPELKYDCREDLSESDDLVIVDQIRRKALAKYLRELEKLAHRPWWETSVEALNVCALTGKSGRLSQAQKEEYEGGGFYFRLLGNSRYRVVIARDPCYQTSFSGANLFLLNRRRDRVFASEIIDGFYSRSDYPPAAAFAMNGAEPIIEIATTSGGLHPTETNYYFTIDPKTARAVPKKLFKIDGRLTHIITSMMLLDEPAEYGLTPGPEALEVIENGRLRKSFAVIKEDFASRQPGGDREKFIRVVYRWNGKYYYSSR